MDNAGATPPGCGCPPCSEAPDTPGRKTVTVLLPVYNEEEALPSTLASLGAVADGLAARYAFEFLIVDDGSTDATPAVAERLRQADPRVAILRLSRNFGKEAAMLAGFDHATGRCVIIMDGDGQHPATVLPRMLELWEEGHDDVYGRRLDSGLHPARSLTSRAYHRLLNSLADIDPEGHDTGDFRLLDRRCVEALRSLREQARYTKGLYTWIGFDKAPVSFATAPRSAGTSKMKLGRLASLALDGITSHSVIPLRLAWVLAALCLVGAVTLFVLALAGVAPAATGPSAAMLFIGAAILLCLAIAGEYLGRIFIETKNRPPYITDYYKGITK